MVQTRIKPYSQQVAEIARRQEQNRLFRRNQALGLLLLALGILVWWSSTPTQLDFHSRLVAALRQMQPRRPRSPGHRNSPER